jgi:hypothetical protein
MQHGQLRDYELQLRQPRNVSLALPRALIMHMTQPRRIRSWIAALVALLVALWLWPRSEPQWTPSLVADQESALTPWQSVNLVTAIAPAGVAANRWWKRGKWKYEWESDSMPFSIRGPEVAWKSGKIGDHTVTVTVESPWGTKKSASISLAVRYRDYFTPDSHLQKPDLTLLPKDPTPEDLPFGIGDVWVEKSKVCMGEPTRIRLTPFDKRGRDKWLVPVVAGEQAWEGTFIVPPTRPGLRMVPVSLYDAGGKKGGHVDSIDTYVFIEVKDCIAPFPMFIEHRPIPPSDDDVAFRLTLYDGPAWLKKLGDATAPSPAAQAASFRWSFGDGATATTKDPRASHQYPPEIDRPDERDTLYKVRVDAIAGDGAIMATSYTSVAVPNHLRQLKQEQDLLQLLTEQGPPGQEDANGTRSIDVVLANIDATETARISNMQIHLISCDGKDAGERSAAPSTVFQNLVIGPRARISGRFSLPKTGLADVCYANVELSGESEPGRLKVLGFFRLVTGDPPGVPLTAAQEAIFQNARELLGNPKIVTVDDVRRLEDEGKIPRFALTDDPFAPDR